jgi:hypothetical protein
VGNDISQLFVSIVLSYYTGRGHRPRWIAMGIYTVVLYCLMSALPHLLYGPGDDALALTVEYGGIVDKNATQEAISKFLPSHHSVENMEADQCTGTVRIS